MIVAWRKGMRIALIQRDIPAGLMLGEASVDKPSRPETAGVVKRDIRVDR